SLSFPTWRACLRIVAHACWWWWPMIPLLRSMAPLAPLVRADRPQEIALAEGWPIDINEAEFGVGHLPQEKVGHSLLPRSADHEVRVGHAAGVQVLRHQCLADVLQADLAVIVIDEDPLDRIHQLLPGTVGQADGEHQPVVILCGLLCHCHR